MSKCQFCKKAEDNTAFDEPIAEHLVITIKGDHTHIHGPVENEYVMVKMVQAMLAEMEKHGIKYHFPQQKRFEIDDEKQ